MVTVMFTLERTWEKSVIAIQLFPCSELCAVIMQLLWGLCFTVG